jgi:hypothetical protein
MVIDWVQLAHDVGSIHETGQSGGTLFAEAALDKILGEENIRAAVELAISGRKGSELAMNVLRYIRSQRAVQIAYEHYNAGHENADLAVWLIKHIAHPCSLPWIAGFLRDPKVWGWGIGVLDQLVWGGWIDVADVEPLIAQAEAHEDENVREQAAFIRQYVEARTR